MKEQEIIAALSHSYFDYVMRDVSPFLPYSQAMLNLKFNELDVDYEIIERLFFMACLNSKDIVLPFNYSCVLDTRTMVKCEWLKEGKSFGNKNKQGIVVKGLMFENVKVVIKREKTPKFSEITARDFCIGISLNKIVWRAPFFVRTLGSFVFKNDLCIVTEFVDGISLKSLIHNKKTSFVCFLNIFFQILLGLEIAQEKLNFSHYDLHTDNVILVLQKQPFNVSLHGRTYRIKHCYKPVMIDFGLSSVCVNGRTLGQKNLETKGIQCKLCPGYDIYVFLLFCLDIAQACNNTQLLKGIMDLLSFFELNTTLSMDELTNNHVKCLENGVKDVIPNQFISHIMQEYSAFLNVEDITAIKKNHECLGKQPIAVKLKQLFELEFESVTAKCRVKGYMKSLLRNIKIYYWYKHKINITLDEIKELIKVDEINLKNIIDDLNLEIDNSVSVEQKNIFFASFEYYNLISELKLNEQYPFYATWMSEFENTFVYKNLSKQLNRVLYEERIRKTS